MSTQTIQINCLETQQTIEGFGCFAGREKDFFRDPKRDAIMEELYKQLQLSIIRSEIKPSFSTAPGVRNFDMNADLDIPPNDPYFNGLDQDEVQRRSQLWVLKNAHQYKPKKIIASTWSPPYYMKTSTLKRLKPSLYSDFANFLADYVIAYRQADIRFFAISPQNEPENVFSPWDVCLWFSWDTATFVEKHMRPIFDRRGLSETKIIVGESANWTGNNVWLSLMSKEKVDIIASHGYSLPDLFNKFSVNYNINPLGDVPSDFKKSVWITEVCSTQSFDPSMTMGLQAAICLHKFLAVKNVNAFIFWLGMVRGNSNEALICSDGQGHYQLTKVFDVMGNYSRYIKDNYSRVTTNSASLNKDIYVSAFKKTDSEQLSIVTINASDENVAITLQLNNSNVETLVPYLTPSVLGVRWQERDSIHGIAGQFTANLCPKSVTTFISQN